MAVIYKLDRLSRSMTPITTSMLELSGARKIELTCVVSLRCFSSIAAWMEFWVLFRVRLVQILSRFSDSAEGGARCFFTLTFGGFSKFSADRMEKVRKNSNKFALSCTLSLIPGVKRSDILGFDSFHQPDSFNINIPDSNIWGQPVDKHPAMVPRHVTFFFLKPRNTNARKWHQVYYQKQKDVPCAAEKGCPITLDKTAYILTPAVEAAFASFLQL